MSEKLKKLTLTLDDKKVALTIRRATARDGVNRLLIASKCEQDGKNDTDEATKILRLTIYPDCLSVTTIEKGLPTELSFEDFANLPEELVAEWVNAVYSCNSTWRAKPQDEKEGGEIDEAKKELSQISQDESKIIAENQPMKI